MKTIYTLENFKDMASMKIYDFLKDDGTGTYFKDKKEVMAGVFCWNEYHFISYDRTKLRAFGKELKRNWIEEARKELEMLENLKITTKY